MPAKNYRVIAKSGLNIRSGPGTEYEDLGDLPPGESVLSPDMSEFVPILLEDNSIGWAARKYLEEVSAQQEPPGNLEEGVKNLPGAMKTSPRGLEFIKAEEGCVLHVYNDPAGYPTIGVGHLIKEGEEFGEITEEEALGLLAQDLKVAEEAIHKNVRVPLNQDQFDALASFIFNVGSGNFQKSTLLKLLNQGQYDAVPGELAKWRKAGGKVLPGLVKRRQREAELWGATVAPMPQAAAPSPARQFPVIGRAGKWKGIIGQAFSPKTFREYVRSLFWEDWRPEFIVLHNTEDPNLAMLPQGIDQEQIETWINWYRDRKGWSAGPHVFVDDRQIWVFTPLTVPGVHANSWNSRSLGVEMLGDFRREPFDEGRGSMVKANAVATVAILSEALGLDPETIMLHRENGETEHYCPGDHVGKQEFIRLVKEYGA